MASSSNRQCLGGERMHRKYRVELRKFQSEHSAYTAGIALTGDGGTAYCVFGTELEKM